MKKILISKENVKFSEITNKSKRKVYKEISKRYNGNNISENTPFDFYRDIPKIAPSFFEECSSLFDYRMKKINFNQSKN